MKPIKGMNLDVSPDAQPPNTYRHARNWVYDKTFDGLMQEPGHTALATHQSRHAVGQYAYENGDIVFLTVASNAATGGEEVVLYTAATNTFSIVYNDSALVFNRARIYDFASFRNTDNERILIISDGIDKPLSINIDVAAADQPPHALQYLFATREQANLKLDVRTSGSLGEGSYFLAIRYVMEDKTKLSFGPIHGPFTVTDSTGFIVELTNLDTNYEGYEIAVVAFVNNSPSAFIGAAGLITGATQNSYIEGTPIKELVLEDVIVGATTYQTAGSLEVHENRLYLGNVSTPSDPVDLQQIANKIQPIWVLSRGVTAQPSEEPETSRFQPDEVYAFYVSYIREDGSQTRAYHIPGRAASSTIAVPINAAASDTVNTGTTRTINPKATLKAILESTSTNEVDNHENALEYLKNDRQIFISGDAEFDTVKYFHTRGTAKAFTNQTAYHFGECGYWENDNETYPTGFPVGTTYTWNASGLSVASVDSAVVLAGEKVRHHRVPSLGWMFENVSDFDFQANKDHAFQMRFEYLELPTGIKGAVLYHAKRTNSNNLVLAHTPIHFGAANHYSVWGEGGTVYRDYSTVSPVNAPLRNNLLSLAGTSPGAPISSAVSTALRDAAGDPKKADGTSFSTNDYFDGSDASQASLSVWDSEFSDRVKVHYNKGAAMPHDLLGAKPALPQKVYTRLEYVLMAMEEYPDDISGHPSVTNGNHHTMQIADTSDAYYYADTTLPGTPLPNSANRSGVFNFVANVQVNRPFPQSEILPTRNIRYVPAGVVDDEVKFDNRFGTECLYWDYALQSTGYGNYAVEGHHNMGARMWYSILNNTDTQSDDGTGDTDNASFTNSLPSGGTNTQTNNAGYFVNTQFSANDVLAVQRLPFVNVTAMRFDCYFGIEAQDLVACTQVITLANTTVAPSINSQASTLRRVAETQVHGDIKFSERRYRVTSSSGWNVGFSSSVEDQLQVSTFAAPDISSQALAGITSAGTVSNSRGSVRMVHKVPTYGPVESKIHLSETVQGLESEFEACYREVSPQETNDVSFISSLLKLNDWIQPLIHVTTSEYPTSFAYRIARSSKQDLGTSVLAYRSFPALDYLEQPRTRGVITNLQSYSDKLLIHHEQSLFVTVGKESVATSSGQLVIGTGDIFRITPSEIAPSEFGFGGTQHKQSAVLTPRGYFYVDALQGKAFLYNGKLEEISNRGMRDYLKDALKLNTTWFPGGNAQSYYPGVLAEYDSEFNRVMLMIRNNTWVGSYGVGDTTLPLNLKDYHGSTVFKDQTDILSYSFNNSAWVAFHDLRMNAFVASGTNFYSWNTEGVASPPPYGTNLNLFKLNDFTNASITYNHDSATTTVDPYIDIAFPAKESVQWQSFSWHTKAIEHVPNDANAGHIDLTKTFVKAAVYNDYQCSGNQTFIKPGDIDIQTYQRVTLRHNGTQYQFNGFRDLVSDRSLRFIDDSQEFVTANINAATVWHDQRRFNSTHAILRLIAPTTTTNLLYLHDVDAKVRKAYR